MSASAVSASSGPVGTLLAEFNPLGAPLTPVTTQGSGASPAITYGGFNPEPSQAAGLNAIAIDQTGNIWVGDTENSGNVLGVTPNLALLTPASPILLNVNVNSMAIDGTGNLWLGGSNLAEFQSDGTQLIAPTNGSTSSSPVVYTQLSSLAFDANSGLWGADSYNFDLYQSSTADGSITYDAFPAGGYFTSLAADSAGNIYGCGDAGGQILDIFNSGAKVHSYPIATGRGCGSQLVLDGLGHLLAVSNAFFPAVGAVVDELTPVGQRSRRPAVTPGPAAASRLPSTPIQIQRSRFPCRARQSMARATCGCSTATASVQQTPAMCWWSLSELPRRW